MLTTQERVIVLFLIAASIVGLGVLYYRNVSSAQVKPEIVRSDASLQEQPQLIYVDVSGAVWKPGVYELKIGARVEELLAKAMLRPDADVDAVNRAMLLSDGQKVVVPVKGDSASPASRNKGVSFPQKIDINTATEEELQKLPHIGEVRARDIIKYRETHGPFQSVDELKNVPGIGEETLNQLKDLVVAE